MLSPRPASSFRTHPTIPFPIPDLETVLLTPYDGVLLTGSIIAGLANEASDFDLYIITLASDSGSMGDRPVAFYAEDNRHYFDVEILPIQDILRSFHRFPFDEPRADLKISQISQRDFVMSFRVAFGHPIANASLCSWAASLLDVDEMVAIYSRWALLHYTMELAKARVLYHGGLGASSQASVERAVLFFSEASAAALGDGYPSLKFTFDKLKRSAGADSVLFERCWQLKSRGKWSALEYLQRAEELVENIPGARLLDYLRSVVRLVPSAEVISVLEQEYLTVHNVGAVPVQMESGRTDRMFDGSPLCEVVKDVYHGDTRKAVADAAFLLDRGFATMEYAFEGEAESGHVE